MKRSTLFGTLLVSAFFLFSGVANAQPGWGYGGGKFHDDLKLTKDQETKIEALRTEHLKKMVDLQSEVTKARLSLKELMAKGDYSRADYLAALAKVDKARENLMTARANHQMDVYELLDKDQKALWNKFKSDRPRGGNGAGYGRGFHKGNKNGYGRGMGRGNGMRYRDGSCFTR
ncbi:MAG: periplasmic heavy metal sensor [Ignavibacteriales bacterium]|nr:MAG: periplasmic heavy metal sensor [Ignavibacteriaceae bacterium]MBW7872055.1 periplasmic heavy metal sensor [Ignavibacteria bacterium]MCZ2143690.1 periplasmic heavy metal sensor [Ignavibacteriales bacterium]MBV6446048.1 hypothetical protein [Ignavibacteriaceae bacterium]MBZ0195725.1 periplasmic heavy metal sensor [Ignavibacteriaceae bacterium]